MSHPRVFLASLPFERRGEGVQRMTGPPSLGDSVNTVELASILTPEFSRSEVGPLDEPADADPGAANST